MIKVEVGNEISQEIEIDLSSLNLIGHRLTLYLQLNQTSDRWFFRLKKLYNGELQGVTNMRVLQSNVSLIPHLAECFDLDLICMTSDVYTSTPLTQYAFTDGNASGDNYGIFLVSKDEARTIQDDLLLQYEQNKFL